MSNKGFRKSEDFDRPCDVMFDDIGQLYKVPALAKSAGFVEKEKELSQQLQLPLPQPTREQVLKNMKVMRENAENAEKILNNLNKNKEEEEWVKKMRKFVEGTKENAKTVEELFVKDKASKVWDRVSNAAHDLFVLVDEAVKYGESISKPKKDIGKTCRSYPRPAESATSKPKPVEDAETRKAREALEEKRAAAAEMADATESMWLSSLVLDWNLSRHYNSDVVFPRSDSDLRRIGVAPALPKPKERGEDEDGLSD